MEANIYYDTKNMDSINDELSRIRLENIRLNQERKNEVFEKVPEIKALFDELRSYSLSAAKARVMKKENSPSMEEAKAHIKETTDKKRKLLVASGYPEDYLDEIFSCKLCKDTGIYENDRCICVKSKIIDSLYSQSNIRKVIERENFDTFSLDYYSKDVPEGHKYSAYVNMSNILKSVKQFTEDFETEEKSILFYGNTGLGKTFLSNCIAKALLDKGKSVLYLSSNQLFYDVIQEYSTSFEKSPQLTSLYRYIFNCDLLIIDDLGTEQTTDSKASRFYDIINQRQINGKSTVISTNLSLNQLQDRYSQRIMSRLVSNYKCFYIYGEDIRFQKRRATINKKQ